VSHLYVVRTALTRQCPIKCIFSLNRKVNPLAWAGRKGHDEQLIQSEPLLD